jgi:DNA-binding NtrC family response regulator
LGNYERVTHVLRSLGIIEWKRGRLERAKDLCQQAFRIATEAGDQQAKICADQLAALIILHAGDFSDAESQLKRTLSFSGEGAESRLLLLSREFIGDVELEQGRASSALNQYEEAFHDAFLRAPRGDVVAELRRRRAECFYIIGKIQEAYAEAQYAMEHCRALGDRYEEAATYRVAALSAAALGRNSEAKQLFEQGLALFEDIETPYEWGKLWLAYGDWLGSNPAEADGANVNAQDAYRAARDLFERMGARARLADAESRLARIGSATEPVAMLEPAAPRAASQLASRKSRSKELEQRSAWVLENFGVVTANIALIETLETVGKLARSKSPILVLGESGTGKELVAHAVHQLSGRRGEFLAINCAALPRDVVESELFGHVAGAFTGATRDKLGLLEACDGGTALLDEIGEMSPDLQSRLLRFLESGEIRKVGATRVTRVNTRIVAATNRDNAWLRGGQGFRADLYYRLAHAVIQLPPLRLRGGLDIELLATHFLEVACTEEHKQVELSAAAVSKLTSYGWPGNVRELKATISQRVVLAPDGHVVQAHEFRFDDGATPGSLDEEIEDVERKRIQEALRQTANSRADAARLLGIPRTTLINRIKRLGLE